MTTLTATILSASVLVAGLGLAALPNGGEARQAAFTAEEASYAVRLDEAFRLADIIATDDEVVKIVAAARRKADRLQARGCDGQAWPHVGSACLLADAAGGRPAVRTVTVEYRVGDSTSVLVRLPAPQIAGR